MTSSLMKDMNSKVDLYRSNAIRVLCSITDAGLLGQIEDTSSKLLWIKVGSVLRLLLSRDTSS